MAAATTEPNSRGVLPRHGASEEECSVIEPDQIVRDLQQLIEKDPDVGDLLEKSLRQAHRRAERDLNRDLFAALDWPQSLEGYYSYLQGFIRWIPKQSNAEAWRSSSPEQRYAKEVSDRMSHFYFLVDQRVGEDETAVPQNSDEFRAWMTRFARQWGNFLNTPDSFNQEMVDSFLQDAPEYHVEESLVDGRPNNPSGWVTFNQFFARQLNHGLRPITEPSNNLVPVSPADCQYIRCYDIDNESNIPAVTIKENHRYGNIKQLMEGSQYADAFANGTFVHYMLPPSAYHRYHVPVAGEVKDSFMTQGKVFMQVDLADHQLQAKDSARSGYEFSQTRGVLTVDTGTSDNGDLGVVAVIPVGMAHVASVNMTAVPGKQVAKGEEFGYFLFGGSDIIVLFQEGVRPDIDTSENFRLVGTPIARCQPIR
jgi:phosphatidylserine decarboxylase precursor